MQLKIGAIAASAYLKEIENSLKSVAKENCQFKGWIDLESAINGISAFKPHLAIVEESFRKKEDVDAVDYLRSENPDGAIVLLVSGGGLISDVEMMKAGAFDYLQIPIDEKSVERIVNGITERISISETRQQTETTICKPSLIISHSPEMERVLSIAARAAASEATVLIKGESGTGKELVARAIHLLGPRRYKPFVTVNIAALSENLIESELFGHVKGSFTGALNDRQGRFNLADTGTLFIDEIGEIPEGIQVKLLRVLQFGTFERVGDNATRKTNVRIIAATNRRLDDAVKAGRFRADLYYRINVVPVAIPPLRERRADIPYLIEHFIEKHSAKSGKIVRGITAETVARIMKYNFPGNVRELENFIERGVVLAHGDLLTETEVFPADIEGPVSMPDFSRRDIVKSESTVKTLINEISGFQDYENIMREFEKRLISKALSETSGNVSAASRILNIGERRLRYRMQILGFEN